MTEPDPEREGEPMPASDAADRSVVKSARRSLELLETFAECRRPLKLTEIARMLGMPASSTSMLLKSLVHLGYLSFDEKKKTFFPTRLVTFLGSWLDDDSSEASIDALLEDLSLLTEETVVLAVEAGRYVHYVKVVEGTHPIRYHVQAGTRRLLPTVNLGLALLSLRTDEDVEQIMRGLRMGPGEECRFSQDDVLEMVQSCRALGYSSRPSMLVQGAGVVAMPLRTRPAMAIGVGGILDRLQGREDEIAALMRDRIEHFLGEGIVSTGPGAGAP